MTFNETREALAQQTAAAGVLNVISNSVADAEPAFKAIADACRALFGSDQVVLSLVDDAGKVRHERSDWPPHVPRAEGERQWAALNAEFPRPLAQSYQAYPLRKRHVIHYPDMAHGPGVPEAMRQNAREVGNFSMLIAPMQTETRDLGTIHIVRAPPRPFSEKESALLRSYADQAVIAIQNARLFNETREVSMAAITAAICMGPDVHPVKEERWKVGLAYAFFWLMLGLFSPVILTLIAAMPPQVMLALVALALLGALTGALATAMHVPDQRFAATLTLGITAAGLPFLGIGAAFWGLVAGVGLYSMERAAALR